MNIPALSQPLHQPGQTAAKDPAAAGVQSAAENRKIGKSSKDFEALLLTQWLEKAYQSFGALPGGDEADELGSGSQQFQGIAMEGLATAIANGGGIGIAKIMAEALHKSTHGKDDIPDPAKSISPLTTDISPGTIEINSSDGR